MVSSWQRSYFNSYRPLVSQPSEQYNIAFEYIMINMIEIHWHQAPNWIYIDVLQQSHLPSKSSNHSDSLFYHLNWISYAYDTNFSFISDAFAFSICFSPLTIPCFTLSSLSCSLIFALIFLPWIQNTTLKTVNHMLLSPKKDYQIDKIVTWGFLACNNLAYARLAQ